MIDPLLQLVLAFSLSLLLLAAAQHKRADPHRFRAQLQAYDLLPELLLPAAGRALPWIEIVAGVLLLLPATRGAAGLLSALLFALYAAAIFVNLLRGRHRIDCGCGGPAQPLSYWLVVRNLLLLGAAGLLILPTTARSLRPIDALAVFALTALLVLCYAAVGQLLHNQAALRGWSHYER